MKIAIGILIILGLAGTIFMPLGIIVGMGPFLLGLSGLVYLKYEIDEIKRNLK